MYTNNTDYVLTPRCCNLVRTVDYDMSLRQNDNSFVLIVSLLMAKRQPKYVGEYSIP